MSVNIHQGQPMLNFGKDIAEAKSLVILIHGRGADAQSMLPLAEVLDTGSVHFLIPQAALNRWYPQSAFVSLEANEPDLSSARKVIDELVDQAHSNGFSDQQIYFGGFSQGACLAADYVARNAKQYGGLFVFSGALIGPPGMPRDYPGTFDHMPVFIGGSDIDPWVAHDLMQDTASLFEQMGAEVDFRTYAGMAHTVNQDEIDAARSMLANADLI
jgi:predicted esterase